jgi:hypothetical protein
MILKKREYWIGILIGILIAEWTNLFFAALQQGIGK